MTTINPISNKLQTERIFLNKTLRALKNLYVSIWSKLTPYHTSSSCYRSQSRWLLGLSAVDNRPQSTTASCESLCQGSTLFTPQFTPRRFLPPASWPVETVGLARTCTSSWATSNWTWARPCAAPCPRPSRVALTRTSVVSDGLTDRCGRLETGTVWELTSVK